MTQFKIAIIGAGPAGCLLARLLVEANIEVTVFEGETTPDVRSQGGTLDLHTNSGIAALKEAGLYENFLQHARFDGEALKLTDKALRAYIRLPGGTTSSRTGRPEIDRVLLRKLLYESLPQDTIRWGYRLRSVSDDLTLHFDQGEEKGFDFIVGADGAWSKVRPLLTDVRPLYSHVSGFHFKVSDVEERYPDLHRLVNRGSLFSYSDGHGMSFQQMGDGSLSCGEWAVREESWDKLQDFDLHDSKAAKAFLLQEYRGWSPQHLQVIQAADEDSFIFRQQYMLPNGNTWENKPGVTLVGDAAHLTVPFAGEGVNIAMEDSMKLAQAIIKAEKSTGGTALTPLVASFEADMFRRAKDVQWASFANLQDLFLTAGAPRTVIERWVIRGFRRRSGPVLGFLFAIPVYIFYWFFKLIY